MQTLVCLVLCRHCAIFSMKCYSAKLYMHKSRNTNIQVGTSFSNIQTWTVIVIFSKLRPSGLMLSISQNVRLSVCLCVCSLLRYRFNVFLPLLLKVRCPIFLEIRNPWGKVLKEVVSDLYIFVWKLCKIAALKKVCIFADFALQNKVETTLPDGLETSGWRAYR